MSIKSYFNTRLPASHREIWLAAIGGFITLWCVMGISHITLGLQGAAMLLASMGASITLIFSQPHSAVSQPWAVIGGHTVSALVGVSCGYWTSQPMLAAALAVMGAFLGMQYLKCLHPPGGATALSAVIGGSAIQQLGFQYVLTPVLLNTLTLILVATLFNYPFAWRRYPRRLYQHYTAV